MVLSWDPFLELGVAAIDDQHRELFRRVDRLLEAMRDKRGDGEVARLLEFLSEYVVSHFAAEEALMEERGYPDVEGHRAEHRRFLEELRVLRGEHAADGATTLLAVHVTNRVTAWLRSHIYGTDRRLGAFLTGSR